MKIQYEVTVDDLVAFISYQAGRSLRRQNPGGIAWIIIATFVVFVVMATLVWNGAEIVTLMPLLIILGVLYKLGFRPNISRSFRKQYEEALPRGAVGPHELELTEDYLVQRTPYSEYRTPLQDIQRVASDGERTFLYYGPASAYVIPDQAVSERELEAFVEAVRMRLSEVPADPDTAAHWPRD